jgi:hydrogenase maturation protease
MQQKKTVVVGLGNPILGDDGVGWAVAEQLQRHRNLPSDVEIINLGVGGLRLMEHIVGYDYAIIIDAIYTGKQPPGHIIECPLDAIPDLTAGHTSSVHDTSLSTALEMGRQQGIPLPESVHVVGIESKNIHDFSEELSPAVAKAVPKAAQVVLKLLDHYSTNITN